MPDVALEAAIAVGSAGAVHHLDAFGRDHLAMNVDSKRTGASPRSPTPRDDVGIRSYAAIQTGWGRCYRRAAHCAGLVNRPEQSGIASERRISNRMLTSYDSCMDTKATAVPASGVPKKKRVRWVFWMILLLLVLPALLFAGYVWGALHISYSSGERAGYIQKISKKGWVCKTWEGELAITNFPGTAPQLFEFSVRDDSVAQTLQRAAGQRVALTYEQHKGVPSACFAETEYWVTAVRTLGP